MAHLHNFRLADATDTTLQVTRSGRGLGPTQHRPRITVTSDRHDPSISHMDALGEGYGPEDGVDIDNGDAVLAINNEPDDVDALHDAGKLVEPLMKCRSAAIRVRGELADRIRKKRKRGSVVTPHRIDVLFDYLINLLAHAVCRDSCSSRPVLRRAPLFQLPAILGGVEMALRGCNQAVALHSPFLKTAYTDPAARASRPGVRAGESPAVLDLIAPLRQLIHDYREVRKSGHERVRHLGDCAPSDRWRAVIDSQRPFVREEGGYARGILTTPCSGVVRCEIS